MYAHHKEIALFAFRSLQYPFDYIVLDVHRCALNGSIAIGMNP